MRPSIEHDQYDYGINFFNLLSAVKYQMPSKMSRGFSYFSQFTNEIHQIICINFSFTFQVNLVLLLLEYSSCSWPKNGMIKLSLFARRIHWEIWSHWNWCWCWRFMLMSFSCKMPKTTFGIAVRPAASRSNLFISLHLNLSVSISNFPLSVNLSSVSTAVSLAAEPQLLYKRVIIETSNLYCSLVPFVVPWNWHLKIYYEHSWMEWRIARRNMQLFLYFTAICSSFLSLHFSMIFVRNSNTPY